MRTVRQPRHYLEERRCAALNCQKRTRLVRVKTFVPGVLVAVWLCKEHEAEHTAAIHAKFREEFGLDFVDAERQ